MAADPTDVGRRSDPVVAGQPVAQLEKAVEGPHLGGAGRRRAAAGFRLAGLRPPAMAPPSLVTSPRVMPVFLAVREASLEGQVVQGVEVEARRLLSVT